MDLSRRDMLVGVAAGAMPGVLAAAPYPARPMFDGTPVAANKLARHFQPLVLPLPAVALSDGHALVSMSSLAGKARIVTLWAEWCVPCILEARDLAPLRKRHAGPGFDIVSVLTLSKERLDYRDASAFLAQQGAAGMPLLIEPDGGYAVLRGLGGTMARPGGLPCTLLVDGAGRIRARATGVGVIVPASKSGAHALSAAEQQALLEQKPHTQWSTPDGEAFIVALRDGLLDRLG